MLVTQLKKEIEGERGRADAAEEFVKLATESLQVIRLSTWNSEHLTKAKRVEHAEDLNYEH
jgi:hypothetical protein